MNNEQFSSGFFVITGGSRTCGAAACADVLAAAALFAVVAACAAPLLADFEATPAPFPSPLCMAPLVWTSP